jgi:putative transposase
MHLILPRTSFHIVWGTPYRRPMLVPSIEPEVHQLLAERCRRLDAVPLAINGMSDHVHVLVDVPLSVGIPRLVGALKGASSHAINHGLLPDRGFRWQRGYAVFSVSPSAVPDVTCYIEEQKLHHAQGRAGRPDWET